MDRKPREETERPEGRPPKMPGRRQEPKWGSRGGERDELEMRSGQEVDVG